MGNVESLLTPSQRNELEELTPFTDREIMRLLHVYTMYDRSEKGDSGITWKTCKMIPQLTNNRLIVQAVEYYLHQTHNLYPREFVLLCGILSSQTTAENKKEFIFRMLDTHCSGVLKHEALFGFYKSLLGGAISDDQILNLISNALQSSPDNPGMITKAQFMKTSPNEIYHCNIHVDHLFGMAQQFKTSYHQMIPNEEMLRKFTVDFLTNKP